MKKENKKNLSLAVFFLLSFLLWTIAVKFIDVKQIGPNGSSVGFATINRYVHEVCSVHFGLYNVTDWLGLVPIAFAMGFAVLGVVQWIKRKKLFKVDFSLFSLGMFYISVIAVYILFENIVINYRPVLINGYLESSYPSSTTLLVLCVMPTSIMQLNCRIKRKAFRICVNTVIIAFIVFMVIARLISGVHWFSDIIGGLLLSCGLVLMYRCFIK